MSKVLPSIKARMVKTCSAKCPVCQRVIADSSVDSLATRVKRHARTRHQKDLHDEDIEIQDLSFVTRVFGSEIGHESDERPRAQRARNYPA